MKDWNSNSKTHLVNSTLDGSECKHDICTVEEVISYTEGGFFYRNNGELITDDKELRILRKRACLAA